MRALPPVGNTTPVQRHERGKYRHEHTKIYRSGEAAINAVQTTLFGWWPHGSPEPGSRFAWWNYQHTSDYGIGNRPDRKTADEQAREVDSPETLYQTSWLT